MYSTCLTLPYQCCHPVLQEATLQLETLKVQKDAAHKLKGQAADGKQAVQKAEVRSSGGICCFQG